MRKQGKPVLWAGIIILFFLVSPNYGMSLLSQVAVPQQMLLSQFNPADTLIPVSSSSGSPFFQRHYAARLHRDKDLDQRVRSGQSPDPFHGNYILVPLDDVAATFQVAGNKCRMVVLTGDNSGDLQRLGEHDSGSKKPAEKYMDVASGDLNGNGRDEIVSACLDTGSINVMTTAFSPPTGKFKKSQEKSWNHESYGNIRLATGYFNSSASAQIVLAWEDGDNKIHLQLFEADEDLKLTAKGTIHDETLSGTGADFEVDTGDFDGDGDDEIVLAWSGPDVTMFVKIYDVDDSLIPVAKGKSSGETLAGNKQVALATGDFTYSARDDIAVAWEREDGTVSLRLYGATDKLNIDSGKGNNYFSDANNPDLHGVQKLIAVASGNFNIGPVDSENNGANQNEGGQDEIVLAYEAPNQYLALKVFQTDSNLDLSNGNSTDPSANFLKSQKVLGGDLNYNLCGVDLAVSVGSLHGGLINSIVVGCVGSERNFDPVVGIGKVTVGTVSVSPDLTQIGELKHSYTANGFEKKLNIHLGLTLGDFDGDSIRVGPPKHFTKQKANNILAVINAPPTDSRLLDPFGSTYEPTLSFEKMKTKTGNLSIETNKDWGYSTDLSGNLGVIGIGDIRHSLRNSYGKNFSRSSDAIATVNYIVNYNQTDADLIIRNQSKYDLWEYPVYNNASEEVKGYILVIFPEGKTLIPKWSDMEGSSYSPNHQIKNLLSYSSKAPKDMSQAYSDSQGCIPDQEHFGLMPNPIAVGGGGTNLTFSWMKNSTTRGTRSQRQDQAVSTSGNLNLFFKGVDVGIMAEVEGSYGTQAVSTHGMTLETMTTFILNYPKLGDVGYAYTVQPLVYWSRYGGYLVLDYQVSIPQSQTAPNAWQETYNKPDLAFSFPQKYATGTGVYPQMTRDLVFLKNGINKTTLQATVHNYSLVGANNVVVRCYVGDPDKKGAKKQKIGEDQVISNLESRTSNTVSFNWSRKNSKPARVYCRIDPDNKIKEITKENNLGWAGWTTETEVALNRQIIRGPSSPNCD